MSNYMEEIEAEMERELSKLKKNPFLFKSIGILEIVRAIDDIFCYYNFSLAKCDDENLDWYIYFKNHTNGFYQCYEQLCYDEEQVTKSNILYNSTEASKEWANYALKKSGNIGFVYRYSQLVKQKLFKIEKTCDSRFLFKCIIPASGAEYIESQFQKKYLENKFHNTRTKKEYQN